MDIVTIDFETYYDKDYSLSKMTTEKYVRSPDFEVIGVGVKVNNYPTDWYSGDNVGRFLKSLDYRDKAILCHNTAFDGAILSWHYGIKPKLWLDTLSMARPQHSVTVGGSLKALTSYYGLGEKGTEVINALGKRRTDFTPEDLARYASYCVNDVELTYALFRKLKQGFPVSEILVIDQTIRMYTEPMIELDVPMLEQHLMEVKQKKFDLLRDMGINDTSDEAVKKVLMSNQIFSLYLTKLGVEPPTKVSLRTGKETFAFGKTDKAFTDLLHHSDERVQTAVAARLGVKSTLEETRTHNLIGVAERGRLPIMLNYYGAHTGRFSGGDKLNLQNLPSRGGNNTIRRALKAPDNHKLISCDSSQIEARLVAWLAGQDDLVQAFRDGRDVYCEFASDVYGRTITAADKIERFVGKTAVLSLGYGAGAAKFKEMLRIQNNVVIEQNEAERIVRLYRQKNHKIVELWRKCDYALKCILSGTEYQIGPVRIDAQGMWLPNGMVIQYPYLRATNTEMTYINDARQFRKVAARVQGENSDIVWTKIYGGKVTENLVQALAALSIREQSVKIGKKLHVVFQVHDEIVVVVPGPEATDAEKYVVACMSEPPAWATDLPVACESGVADNYGDT
jgi:DNA polymerase I-like protein with 3'-5' exonuclease and polymerase domains